MLRRLKPVRVLAWASFVLVPSLGAAQGRTASPLTDSLARHARIAGEEAANTRGVAARAALGFVGGASFGFFAVPAAVGAPIGFVFGGTGLVLVGASVGMEGVMPDSQAVGQGDAYARVYADAYRKRWGQRRRKAGFIGAAAGGVAGFTTFVWVLSIVLDGY